MLIEQAACQVVLGEYSVHNGEIATARQAWEQALRLSQAVMLTLPGGPGPVWRTWPREPASRPAIQAYPRMIANLAKVRRGSCSLLWQAPIFTRQSGAGSGGRPGGPINDWEQMLWISSRKAMPRPSPFYCRGASSNRKMTSHPGWTA